MQCEAACKEPGANPRLTKQYDSLDWKKREHSERPWVSTGNMGWFSSVPDTCGDAVEELRANVQDLLDGNSALQVFASEATLKR